MLDKCDLGSNGFTYTLDNAHKWCGIQVKKIREEFSNDLHNVKGYLYAYRHDGYEKLALDYSHKSDRKRWFPMSFNTGCKHDTDYEGSDVCVPDMTEALHMAGIIIRSIGMPVEIGLFHNETNESLLAKPLTENQTIGHLRSF